MADNDNICVTTYNSYNFSYKVDIESLEELYELLKEEKNELEEIELIIQLQLINEDYDFTSFATFKSLISEISLKEIISITFIRNLKANRNYSNYLDIDFNAFAIYRSENKVVRTKISGLETDVRLLDECINKFFKKNENANKLFHKLPYLSFSLFLSASISLLISNSLNEIFDVIFRGLSTKFTSLYSILLIVIFFSLFVPLSYAFIFRLPRIFKRFVLIDNNNNTRSSLSVDSKWELFTRIFTILITLAGIITNILTITSYILPQ